MKKNNSGFSLVELIVSVAILGIIVAAVGAFAVSGSRAYASVYSGVSLQVESQMALNQVREYAVDCGAGVYAGGSRLCLLDKETAAQPGGTETVSYTEHIFELSDGKLIYTRKTYSAAGQLTGSETGTVSEYVTEFAPVSAADSVTVGMSLERRGKNYTASETMAFRNTPMVFASESDLLYSIAPTA